MTFLFLGSFFYLTYGQLSVNAGIKYKKNNGTYSEYYYRDIELITGKDLNTATKTQIYDQYSNYALVWFDQNEVAIIKLKDPIQPDSDRLLGKPITKTVLEINTKFNGYLKQGVDQRGIEWKLCFYTDPLRVFCD